MPRLPLHLTDHLQWDLERFALPMLLAFVNVRRPDESWGAWTAVPPESRVHWTIRGGAFTDESADWLRETVLADLEHLQASLEDPVATPLRLGVAEVQVAARIEDGRVRYMVATWDLEAYFRFALIEAVRQAVHVRIKPCQRCGKWTLGARVDSRFCSRRCRAESRRLELAPADALAHQRKVRAAQQRRHYDTHYRADNFGRIKKTDTY
jgi:hypothetical protein